MKKTQQDATSAWLKTQYANLLRFRASGTLFARFRVRGKLIRQSLETSDVEVGKRKLDKLVAQERGATKDRRNGKMTFAEAVEEFRKRGFRVAVTGAKKRKPMKDRTRAYYEERIKALLASWPELETMPLRKVAQCDVEAWAERFGRSTCSSTFNHTTSVLRQIMQVAVENAVRHDNPALMLGRMSEKPKKLTLPNHHTTSSWPRSKRAAVDGRSRARI